MSAAVCRGDAPGRPTRRTRAEDAEAEQERGSDAVLRDQIERAMDPGGETRQLSEAFAALARNPVTRTFLRLRGIDVEQVRGLEDERQRLIAQAETVMAALVPLGWAVSRYIPLQTLLEAAEAVAAERPDEADRILCEAMSDDFMLSRTAAQVGSMGHADPAYSALFRERRRLVLKAVAHHEAGSYEASIPIVLAQIEGLTADVTGGKLFFSRRQDKQADVVDDSLLTAVPGHLNLLREHYSEGGHDTRASGSLSRHEVLHGRELAYDTKTNSLKVFALLEAVVAWAQPRADAEAERRRAERWAANAGSDDVTPTGARIDDREFGATRQALRHLWSCYAGHYRNLGYFREDMLRIAELGGPVRKLPAPHGIETCLSEDRRTFWAWRRTVSGWHLGIAATVLSDDGQGDITFGEWLWDNRDAPAAGPDTAREAWGGQPFETPPNWY